MRKTTLALVMKLAASFAFAGESPPAPPPDRQRELVQFVRQDCGACHGLGLAGGLGPSLLPSALEQWPPEALALTIHEGRPDTPMPPWRRFLSEAETLWIAQRLKEGFPR
ncbi:MAG: c-type cytochrome [Azoarcus sp.]|jgi:cytochrome c55X|nr:c-type cytochrome [Azoarcus sp.]